MRILFLHGWHSVPGGVKPTYLREQGHAVFNPQLDDDDFPTALATAQAEFDRHRPDVIIGSSRGGAIAMSLESGDTPLILLCPAWKRWGHATKLKPNSAILHSRQDDVIPITDSEELISASKLPPETLIEVGHDHRLADDASLVTMEWLCRMHASGQPLPWLEVEMPSPTSAQREGAATSQADGRYLCDACGEEIVIPLDLSEGSHQSYVEDCPVCCRANVIHVEIDAEGHPRVWAEPEQDAE
jgi:hypothetical protein